MIVAGALKLDFVGVHVSNEDPSPSDEMPSN
jgi:hypothetical protein